MCVCQRPPTVQTEPDAPSSVRLRATEATALAGDLPLVSLDPVRATYSCPGGPGRVIIVGLAYTHRPAVSLWYADSGCRRLDNGRVIAEGAGHPSYYDHFAQRVDALLQ